MDRVEQALLDYAGEQRKDVLDGMTETARLAKKVYDDAASGASESQLITDIAEYWSASLHYAAAVATNFGVLVAALGMEIRLGANDSDTPTRILALDPTNPAAPKCTSFWMVGDGAFANTQLNPNLVTFSQGPNQTGTGSWTIRFDLKAHLVRGNYAVVYEIPGTPSLTPYLEHFYLDPQPPGS
jgi:hypothetical protein